MKKKYGEPNGDNSYWRNDLYQDNYPEWGFAISLGHLAYYTNWDDSDSEIYLSLTGENYKISLEVEYSGKEYRTLEEEKRLEKTLEEF